MLKTVQEEDLQIVELENSQQARLRILNLGASLFSFRLKDKNDRPVEVVAGPAKMEDYISETYWEHNKCFGASIGRFAGRIAEGKFSIGEEDFKLEENLEEAHLHGGSNGFQTKIWEIAKITDAPNPSVKLTHVSEHMEDGYPGKVRVEVTYTLTEDNSVKLAYRATTDRNTIINLTNHTYFNLNGGGSISDHFMQVNASKILELDKHNLPTGNLTKLRDHSKDYRENKLLGNRELDDVYVLDVMENEVQAQLFAPLTGIKLKVLSDQPVVVIYSPESLPEDLVYLNKLDEKFPAVAIEAQNYPDAPNFRNFPSSLLKPGEVYENNIVFAFSVK
ncbi:aldose epimerase family protein [Christiangramia portivictoriae]|uniref:aldose epimerase family protein n=1 Tax=Christiangramia portivictoriae TaxID=326069 RepID=UPI0004194B16|nr:aldose epimerase family protein [Christiangramia portivictoriae]